MGTQDPLARCTKGFSPWVSTVTHYVRGKLCNPRVKVTLVRCPLSFRVFLVILGKLNRERKNKRLKKSIRYLLHKLLIRKTLKSSYDPYLSKLAIIHENICRLNKPSVNYVTLVARLNGA